MQKLLTRIIAVIAIIALAAAIPISALAEAAANQAESTAAIEIVPHKTDNPERSGIWDGSIATGFTAGSGAEADPYLISDGSELAFLAQEVNNGNGYSGVYFKLTNDIYINDTSNWKRWGNGATPKNTWTVIGAEYTNEFYGCFDGNGYTVRGIYINAPDEWHQGLFGGIAIGSTISNLGVAESYICGDSSAGGVVGYNDGGTVINCYNTGSVTGEDEVGGVVGYNLGAVTNCYNTGNVNGELDEVGGVVGMNYGDITNCYNMGSVTCSDNADNGGAVGGVVGCNGRHITNCYNTGSVTCSDKVDGGEVGGVVGRNWGVVINCYNTGNVTGEKHVGGVIGWDSDSDEYVGVGGLPVLTFDSGFTNCYYLDTCCDNGNKHGTALTEEQMQASDSFTGFDFAEVWTMEGNPGYPYPELDGNSHRGTSTDPEDANEHSMLLPIGIGVAVIAGGVALIRRKE